MDARTFLIATDFLGAGNLGDDLMVAGFVEGLRRLGLAERVKVRALCSYDRESQRKRFPEIEWLDGKDAELRRREIAEAGAILGVGGTPFQVTSGEWLLEVLEQVVALKGESPFLLVNIGSESEVRRARDRVVALMRRMERISTRDGDTLALLEEFRGSEARPELIAGADLANISLPGLCASHPALEQRPHELGVILGCDTLGRADVKAVVDWVVSDKRPVAWITCEVRDIPEGEYRVYRRNRWRFAHALNWPWRPSVTLLRPDYHAGSMADLLRPFAQCRTVLSSRYHGILSAAWSGCRVAGIARSSKVKWLCEQLGVPATEPPLDVAGMGRLQREARVVDRAILEKLGALALRGMEGLGEW
jgi:hypothetical protein